MAFNKYYSKLTIVKMLFIQTICDKEHYCGNSIKFSITYPLITVTSFIGSTSFSLLAGIPPHATLELITRVREQVQA